MAYPSGSFIWHAHYGKQRADGQAGALVVQVTRSTVQQARPKLFTVRPQINFIVLKSPFICPNRETWPNSSSPLVTLSESGSDTVKWHWYFDYSLCVKNHSELSKMRENAVSVNQLEVE